MTIRLTVAATISATIALAAPARADMCDGDLWGGRSSFIQANGALSVFISSQTVLNHFGGHPYCNGDFYVKSELPNSTCSTAEITQHHDTLGQGTQVWAQKTCPGLQYATEYNTKGTHRGFGEEPVYSHAPESIFFGLPPPDPQQECEAEGGTWTCDLVCECQFINCPLILDIGGNGLKLTSAAEGVAFDLRPDGIVEDLAWTTPYSDDAFLVLDRNGNGRIDDGTEMFSNYAPRSPMSSPSGFGALAMFDSPSEGGNGDGYISPIDSVYMSLDLWRDLNHDGVSQPGELIPLNAIVFAISLRYRESLRQDRFGNVFRYRSKVTTLASPPTLWVWDVFLVGR